MKCPLCNPLTQEIIYEDGFCFCIVNKEPLKDGHLMVLPKRHVVELDDLTEKEAKKILTLLDRMSKIISKVYKESPIIFMNLDKFPTQPHLHFHILPSKGGLRDLFSEYEKIPKRQEATKETLRNIADKIKKWL